jgi:hypothetical protein
VRTNSGVSNAESSLLSRQKTTMSWSGLASNKLSACEQIGDERAATPGVERVAVAGDEADPRDDVVRAPWPIATVTRSATGRARCARGRGDLPNRCGQER